MNYGKKVDCKETDGTDLPFFHDGKARQSFFHQSPVRITDSTLHRSNLSGCGVIQGCN